MRRERSAARGQRGDVVGTVVADAFRQEWGRITAALIHQTGDWDLAGECAQDVFTQALRRWPRDGALAQDKIAITDQERADMLALAARMKTRDLVPHALGFCP